VIFPRENEADLAELPPETRNAIEFIRRTRSGRFAAASTAAPVTTAGASDVVRQAAMPASS
jgi:hypothetical protein